MSKKDNKKKDEVKKPQQITLTKTPKNELRQIVGLDTRSRDKKEEKGKND